MSKAKSASIERMKFRYTAQVINAWSSWFDRLTEKPMGRQANLTHSTWRLRPNHAGVPPMRSTPTSEVRLVLCPPMDSEESLQKPVFPEAGSITRSCWRARGPNF